MSPILHLNLLITIVVINRVSLGEIVTPKTHIGHGDESLLQSKYTESLDYSGRIVLSWELGDDKSAITFELWAQTLGYVGFGLSPNGGMAGADIFIAGVFPNGTPYFSVSKISHTYRVLQL